MRADEKYAEIGGAANAPKCECHDEPMGWNPNGKRNGFFYCRAKHRQRVNAAYWRDPIKGARVMDDHRRKKRIERMELELKELLNAS